jgi:hypothetical protein
MAGSLLLSTRLFRSLSVKGSVKNNSGKIFYQETERNQNGAPHRYLRDAAVAFSLSLSLEFRVHSGCTSSTIITCTNISIITITAAAAAISSTPAPNK